MYFGNFGGNEMKKHERIAGLGSGRGNDRSAAGCGWIQGAATDGEVQQLVSTILLTLTAINRFPFFASLSDTPAMSSTVACTARFNRPSIHLDMRFVSPLDEVAGGSRRRLLEQTLAGAEWTNFGSARG